MKFLSIFLLSLVCSLVSAGEVKNPLLDQEVEVPRSGFKESHFLVPENASALEFQGSFRCSGGFNDDVTFLVLTQPEYVRWFSKRAHHGEVKLERKKEGTFRMKATPGETYYFVLDNFFSTVSNKKVRLKIEFVPAGST